MALITCRCFDARRCLRLSPLAADDTYAAMSAAAAALMLPAMMPAAQLPPIRHDDADKDAADDTPQLFAVAAISLRCLMLRRCPLMAAAHRRRRPPHCRHATMAAGCLFFIADTPPPPRHDCRLPIAAALLPRCCCFAHAAATLPARVAASHDTAVDCHGRHDDAYVKKLTTFFTIILRLAVAATIASSPLMPRYAAAAADCRLKDILPQDFSRHDGDGEGV